MIVRGQIPFGDRRKGGRRLLAGTALMLSLALTSTACNTASDDGDSSNSTTVVPETTTTTAPNGVVTPTQQILAGQCLDELPDVAQQPFAVLAIPCEDSHTYEVYGQTNLDLEDPTPPGTPYPGALIVANAAEEQCFAGFTEFMGIQWEASDYDIQVWWPSEPSWRAENDRTVLCAVYLVNGGRTEGTVRGSEL